MQQPGASPQDSSPQIEGLKARHNEELGNYCELSTEVYPPLGHFARSALLRLCAFPWGDAPGFCISRVWR
jgi:hypothetical protein